MKFTDWIAQRLGSRRWVVARASAKLRTNYDRFLSQAQFSALRAEFEAVS
jgi:hypothetical protein